LEMNNSGIEKMVFQLSLLQEEKRLLFNSLGLSGLEYLFFEWYRGVLLRARRANGASLRVLTQETYRESPDKVPRIDFHHPDGGFLTLEGNKPPSLWNQIFPSPFSRLWCAFTRAETLGRFEWSSPIFRDATEELWKAVFCLEQEMRRHKSGCLLIQGDCGAFPLVFKGGQSGRQGTGRMLEVAHCPGLENLGTKFERGQLDEMGLAQSLGSGACFILFEPTQLDGLPPPDRLRRLAETLLSSLNEKRKASAPQPSLEWGLS